MPRNAILKVKDGNLPKAIKDFLRSLLEKNLVEALLVPVELPSGNNVMLTLVTKIVGSLKSGVGSAGACPPPSLAEDKPRRYGSTLDSRLSTAYSRWLR